MNVKPGSTTDLSDADWINTELALAPSKLIQESAGQDTPSQSNVVDISPLNQALDDGLLTLDHGNTKKYAKYRNWTVYTIVLAAVFCILLILLWVLVWFLHK